MTDDEAITLKQFAGVLGVEPSYVTKLKQAGRLVLDARGRVLVSASKKLIAETAGRSDGARNHWSSKRSQKAAAAASSGAPVDLPEDSDTSASSEETAASDSSAEPRTNSQTYWNRREAAARAQLREMELEERMGKLVDVEVVKGAAANIGTMLRSALETLPDQLAPALVGMNDEGQIHAVLIEHMEAVLRDISAKLEAVGELRSQTTSTP